MSFRNGLSIVFHMMQSDQKWRHMCRGSLVRLLTPAQRLSVHLGRVSHRFLPDQFVWVSEDASLGVAGWVSWGEGEFSHAPVSDIPPCFGPRQRANP